jgi:hypothetical protein
MWAAALVGDVHGHLVSGRICDVGWVASFYFVVEWGELVGAAAGEDCE